MPTYFIRYSSYAIVEADNEDNAINVDTDDQILNNIEVLEVSEEEY